MASRMATRSLSRGSSAKPEPPAAPAAEPDDEQKENVDPLQPQRRSQRLIARRTRLAEAAEQQQSDEDSHEDAPAAALPARRRGMGACSKASLRGPGAPAASPLRPVVPLRRPAAGRRAAGRPAKRPRREPELTGLFDTLPSELVDMIIDVCGPRQLARLESTCNYFRSVRKLDAIAYDRLKAIPRAKGMEPNRRYGTVMETGDERVWRALVYRVHARVRGVACCIS